MGISDKIENAAEDFGGKAKETTGKVTGDQSLEAEGKADQLSASIKDGVEKVKDAVSDIADKVRNAGE